MVPRVVHGARKGHRKSRAGCFCCKRRKVKCDEKKPTCTNCTNFSLSCHYTDVSPHNQDNSPLSPPSTTASTQRPSTPPRRGRGRPRKDWAALHTRTCNSTSARSPTSSLSLELASKQSVPPGVSDYSPLNMAQAELLHHFVTCAGPSLAHTDQRDNPIVQFWTENAPRIGFQNSAVLYLALSLSGHHLAHLYNACHESRARHHSLARHYSMVGVAELNKQLLNINKSNCGALYIGAVLVHFGVLAVGPTNSHDLLVCDVGGGSAGKWASLATGARLIGTMFAPDILFSGLLQPLAPDDGCSKSENDTRPRYEYENFPSIDWIDPLNRLKSFIASQDGNDAHHCSYVEAFETLARVYEATFGNKDGLLTVHPGFKLPLSWLYFMDASFVALLRAKDPMALLLLACFAPLLKTIKRAWFQTAWTDHLLVTIARLLGSEYAAWLEWPISVSKSMLIT